MNKTSYLLKSLRPKQYLKNLVIFAAPFFSFHLNLILWAKTVGAFIAFCFISSGIYLLNDIIDLEEDKLHPVKRFRPIAAGQISISIAFKTFLLITLLSLILSKSLGIELLVVIFLYAIIQVFYCLIFKKIPILDLFCISSGFILRAIAGGLVSESIPSFWFLLTISLLSLFVAIEKRKAELLISKKNGIIYKKVIKFYSLKVLVISGNLASVFALISYSLWAAGPIFKGASTQWMLLTLPIVCYSIYRYKLISDPKVAKSIHCFNSEFIHERPEEIFLKDLQLKYAFFIWLFSAFSIFALTRI